MITEISFMLEEKLNQLSPRSREENVIIQYGIELLIENIIKFVFIIFLGHISNTLPETFAFLLSFSLLRTQAGGIHAKTGIRCLVAMASTWGLAVAITLYFPISFLETIGAGGCCLILLYFIAPQFTANTALLSPEKMKGKKINTVILAVIILIFACIFRNFREVLLTSLIAETLTVILEVKRK